MKKYYNQKYIRYIVSVTCFVHRGIEFSCMSTLFKQPSGMLARKVGEVWCYSCWQGDGTTRVYWRPLAKECNYIITNHTNTAAEVRPAAPSPCRNHYHRGRSHILVHSFHLQRATCPTSILGIACYTRETYLRNVAAWSASYEAHLTDIRSIYPKKKILMNQRLPPNQHNVSLIYNASEAWTNWNIKFMFTEDTKQYVETKEKHGWQDKNSYNGTSWRKSSRGTCLLQIGMLLDKFSNINLWLKWCHGTSLY
jgi:hypothetical protein